MLLEKMADVFAIQGQPSDVQLYPDPTHKRRSNSECPTQSGSACLLEATSEDRKLELRSTSGESVDQQTSPLRKANMQITEES